MPKISVIMPVYNVENYLDTAIESVINQTFSDIEIICINDGSTDHSLDILKNYAQKDYRIKIIDQQNQGVSAARNTGVEAASGEYIMFLDPDDTYCLSLCAKVFEKIKNENPDIIIWGHNKINNIDVVARNCNCNKLNYLLHQKKVSTEYIIRLQVYIWDKAFKKTFLSKNNIKFPTEIKQAEDVIFCLLSFYANPKYTYIPEALYFYNYKRPNSLTAKTQNNISNDLIAYKYLCNTKEFQNQKNVIKLDSTTHFLGGSIFYWKNLENEKYREKYVYDITNFLEYIKQKFSPFELLKISTYQKLKHLLFKYKNRNFFNLFDIRTTQKEKIYVVMGKKLIFKRKNSIARREK